MKNYNLGKISACALFFSMHSTYAIDPQPDPDNPNGYLS